MCICFQRCDGAAASDIVRVIDVDVLFNSIQCKQELEHDWPMCIDMKAEMKESLTLEVVNRAKRLQQAHAPLSPIPPLVDDNIPF